MRERERIKKKNADVDPGNTRLDQKRNEKKKNEEDCVNPPFTGIQSFYTTRIPLHRVHSCTPRLSMELSSLQESSRRFQIGKEKKKKRRKEARRNVERNPRPHCFILCSKKTLKQNEWGWSLQIYGPALFTENVAADSNCDDDPTAKAGSKCFSAAW